MRKFLILIVAAVVCSCSNNGLEKPITEMLTVDELKANIKEHSEFADFYEGVKEIRDWVLMDELNQAKYGDITYERLWKYGLRLRDTTFTASIWANIRTEYDAIYPDHTSKVDSIMNHWINYLEENKLEKYVRIEFDELDKEYYSYSGEVRDVNIGFKITPLKGTIQQLVFFYNMKPKIKNDGEFDIISSHSCLASSPINSTTTLYWQADYSDEKRLKYMTTAEVKRDYDFIFKIIKVRVGGVNIDEKADAVPHSVHMALEYGAEYNNFYSDDIIKEFIDKDYISFREYASPKYEKVIRDIDAEVFDMGNAFVNYQKKKLEEEKKSK